MTEYMIYVLVVSISAVLFGMFTSMIMSAIIDRFGFLMKTLFVIAYVVIMTIVLRMLIQAYDVELVQIILFGVLSTAICASFSRENY